MPEKRENLIEGKRWRHGELEIIIRAAVVVAIFLKNVCFVLQPHVVGWLLLTHLFRRPFGFKR